MARFAASLFAASLAVSILGARGDTAFTAPRPPLALTPYSKLAAKKEHRESAKKKKESPESAEKKQKRIECEEQAEKLLYDADKRAYMKECISNL